MNYRFRIYDYVIFALSYVFFYLFIARLQGLPLFIPQLLSIAPPWVYLTVAVILNIWVLPLPGIHQGVAEIEARPEQARRLSEKPLAPSPEERLKRGLAKTHEGFIDKISSVFRHKDVIDDAMLSQLEETLIGTDIGVRTAYMLFEDIQNSVKSGATSEPDKIMDIVRSEITDILSRRERPFVIPDGARPFVIMVTGVNGSGKTTTIAKIARRFIQDGKSVIIASGDTFRAAAIDQLEYWARKVKADFIKAHEGADPTAVAFDALEAAVARDRDVLIIDTAGRLHTKENLMEELKKTKRVLNKKLPGAPHSILLVLDATIGQNAIEQTRQFNKALGITGIVLTKLDGSSKGGVIVGIANEFDIPIHFIGIGEHMDDLQPFDAASFVDAIFLDK